MPDPANIDTEFKSWAIVEAMGRKMVAGYCSQQTIAGATFVRVDVPETSDSPAFTQLFAPGSLYAITPTTEEDARAVAEHLSYRPVSLWIFRRPDPQPRLIEQHDNEETDDWDESPF